MKSLVAAVAALAADAPAAQRRQEEHRLVTIAALIVAALGLAKELGDGPLALWPGRASLRDGLADALGIALAVAYVLRGWPLPPPWRALAAKKTGADETAADEEEGLPLPVVVLRGLG